MSVLIVIASLSSALPSDVQNFLTEYHVGPWSWLFLLIVIIYDNWQPKFYALSAYAHERNDTELRNPSAFVTCEGQEIATLLAEKVSDAKWHIGEINTYRNGRFLFITSGLTINHCIKDPHHWDEFIWVKSKDSA